MVQKPFSQPLLYFRHWIQCREKKITPSLSPLLALVSSSPWTMPSFPVALTRVWKSFSSHALCHTTVRHSAASFSFTSCVSLYTHCSFAASSMAFVSVTQTSCSRDLPAGLPVSSLSHILVHSLFCSLSGLSKSCYHAPLNFQWPLTDFRIKCKLTRCFTVWPFSPSFPALLDPDLFSMPHVDHWLSYLLFWIKCLEHLYLSFFPAGVLCSL